MTSPHSPHGSGAQHPGFGGFQPSSAPPAQRPLKPGTMELAPSDVNGVFSASFATIRANPAASLGVAILPMLLVSFTTVVVALIFLAVLADDLPDLWNREWPWSASDSVGVILSLVLAGLLVALLAALVSSLTTAALIHVFSQGVLGRRATLSASLRAGVSRMWQIFATYALAGIAVMGPASVVLVVAAVASTGSETTAGIIVILGLLALVPLVMIVVVRTAFASSAVVIERLGPIAAIKRSWLLTRGRFWRTFGVMLLVGVITSSLSGVVNEVSDRLMPKVDLTWPLGAGTMVLVLLLAVVTVVVNAVGQAVGTFSATTLYLDACMRDEDLAAALAVATGHATQTSGAPVRLAPGELAFPSSPTLATRNR